MHECEKCGAHWWAMHLVPGSTRPQIATVYGGNEDDELLDVLMAEFRMPEVILVPAYWQVIVSGPQWTAYVTRHDLSFRTRTRHFLDGLRSLLRRAS